ncbi:MAG: hypothetical protein L3J25_10470 [Flavobacteriaceae bacterium]|nr:hypothetical protein [Flavobacteriaceae bacterium]
MDTIVNNQILKRLKQTLCLLLLTTVLACPGDEDCFDLDRITQVADLILLTPEQTEYSQGYTLTLKVDLPATNSYFGDEFSLFEATSTMEAKLTLAFNQLFIDNTLTFVKGRQGEASNWFYLLYNPDNDTYELEVTITLNRADEYSLATLDYIIVKGADDCNRYRIDTNVLWAGDALVEFTVIE